MGVKGIFTVVVAFGGSGDPGSLARTSILLMFLFPL